MATTTAAVAVVSSSSSSLHLHFRAFIAASPTTTTTTTLLHHPPLTSKIFSFRTLTFPTPESETLDSNQSTPQFRASKRNSRFQRNLFKKSDRKKDKEELRERNAELRSGSKYRDSKSNQGRFSNHTVAVSPQRLSKVLATLGVASRRSCEELIFNGDVTVNGPVCKIPQTRVDITKDVIFVNGECISQKLPPKLYFALNKPKGYICSCVEDEGKPVIRLLDKYFNNRDERYKDLKKPRLFTVGRLDVRTSGLIIVTNDGEFAQKIAHPSCGITKEYIASIHGSVGKHHLLTMIKGTTIDGVHCAPDSVELLPNQPELLRPRIRIVVHEGRKHEVREFVKKAGLEISTLRRVRIGSYRIPRHLKIGCFVKLKRDHLEALATVPTSTSDSEDESTEDESTEDESR